MMSVIKKRLLGVGEVTSERTKGFQCFSDRKVLNRRQYFKNKKKWQRKRHKTKTIQVMFER
jgi:hypothetical protein